jgi:hypothetical protein
MSTLVRETIKELLSRVNCSLFYYEKDYVSVKRTPTSDKERCTTFEQFVEARFNYECCQIPELVDAVLSTDGRLFICANLENSDEIKRKFSTATITISPEIPESLRNEILQLLGGSEIVFNNVKKKIRFTIK